MKIRTKIILAFLLLVIPIIILGSVSIWGLNVIDQQINSGTKQDIQSLEKSIDLNSHAQFIRYYDEILTQSARNYAFTGDNKWKDRYVQAAPELDKNIKGALDLADKEDKQIFASIDEANLALITMEEKSMELVASGKKEEAVKILEGTDYANQKEIYKQGLMKYVKKQGKNYEDALSVSTANLANNIQFIQRALESGIRWTAMGGIGTVLFAIFLGIFIARLISNPINVLSRATKDIATGNLDQKVQVYSQDEIGELAGSFNEMVGKVKEARENIENKVKERTAELEKTNKFMTGREIKMIELKKKIAELEKKS